MNYRQMLCTIFSVSVVTFFGDAVHAQQTNFTAADGLFAAPSQGGARRWVLAHPEQVTLLVKPGGTKTDGTAIAPQTVATNFGCIETLGTLWCEIQSLHGGPKGFVLAQSLQPIKGPDGVIARGPNDSAKRAKKKRFDKWAEIQCAQERGEPLAPCPIGVAQSDGGDVTAAVTFKTGFARYLFFMHGAFISASATMSGAGRDTDWRVKDGIHYIRADDQQFEIPHTVLFGAQ